MAVSPAEETKNYVFQGFLASAAGNPLFSICEVKYNAKSESS